MLRIAISGCVGVCIVSAKVSVQFAPPACIVAGQRRHLRAVEANADRLPLVQRQPADVGDDRPALAADRLDIDRLRWNRTPATRYRRGETMPPASRWQRKTSGAGRRCLAWRRPAAALSPALVSAGGSDAATVVFGAASPPRAPAVSGLQERAGFGGSGRRRQLRRRLGFDLDVGLLGDRLRRRRRDLAGLPRCRRFIGGLLGRGRHSGAVTRCAVGRRSGWRRSMRGIRRGDGSADGFSACWKATSIM